MASSFSTLLAAPSFPSMKYIPYVPPLLRPKAKYSTVEPKAKPKMTEPNLCEGRSFEYDREWADIDEFPTDLPEPKALRSPDLGLSALVGAISPFGSLHQSIICLLNTTS